MKIVFSKDTESFNLVARVSEDNMRLFVDLTPTEHYVPLSRQTLLDLIGEFTPATDLNIGVLDDILRNLKEGNPCLERRIKRGIEPQPGVDGKLLLLVKKLSTRGEVSIDEKGFANYGDLNLFDNIKVGQVVARIYPPKKGIDGVDVFGNTVEAQAGQPAGVAIDKTLEIVDSDEPGKNYQLVISKAEGFLSEEGGTMAVQDELLIKDDLDFRYGNISFIGKVNVSGDVLKGFDIKSDKGIVIQGNVRGAGNLISKDGDIVVKGFTYGGGDSRIISGKNFETSIAQEVNAETNGSILVHREAIDCTFRTESSILMPRGTLMGGQAFAVCGVEANVIGNESGKTTVIRLCSDVETSSEYSRLVIKIESNKRALELIALHLGPLAKDPVRIRFLKPEYRRNVERLFNKKAEIEKNIEALEERKKKMLEKAVYSNVVRVNFLSMMHEGTIVQAGEEVFEVKENIAGPKSLDFVPEEMRFELGDLKSLQCSFDSNQEGETVKEAEGE